MTRAAVALLLLAGCSGVRVVECDVDCGVTGGMPVDLPDGAYAVVSCSESGGNVECGQPRLMVCDGDPIVATCPCRPGADSEWVEIYD